jgi:hypothetical protein|tara:strand:+ start:413 stop:580 length:168 start_codon:yes stop_codon:yes gene_type:complete
MERIVVLDDDGTFCSLENAKIWTITEKGAGLLSEGLEPRHLEKHHILDIQYVTGN